MSPFSPGKLARAGGAERTPSASTRLMSMPPVTQRRGPRVGADPFRKSPSIESRGRQVEGSDAPVSGILPPWRLSCRNLPGPASFTCS